MEDTVVARRKDSTALYEVISNRADETEAAKLKVPGWWRSKAATPSRRSSSVKPKPEPAPRPQPRPVSTTDEDVADRPPFMQVREGRVELSLSPVSVAIVVGVVFLAVFTSYQLGSGFQSAAPMVPLAGMDSDQTADAGQRTARASTADAAPPRLSGLKPTGSRKKVEPPGNVPLTGLPALSELEPARRVAGQNYVILESFQVADRDDAVHAQGWFAESQGIRTTLEKSGQWWQLISTEGFDYSKAGEKSRCTRFCETIQKLGQAYKREFAGRYRIRYGFQSPMPKKY